MFIQDDELFDMDNPFIAEKFSLKGGGGTDFHPVFDLIAEDEEDPEIVLYLTDGYGSAPKKQPNYPVIWGVIEGGIMPVKWGQMMEIKIGS